jgi:hypothetical protein
MNRTVLRLLFVDRPAERTRNGTVVETAVPWRKAVRKVQCPAEMRGRTGVIHRLRALSTRQLHSTAHKTIRRKRIPVTR